MCVHPSYTVYLCRQWSPGVLRYFSSCLVWGHKPWGTPWDPYKVPLVLMEALPRNRGKSWHYKKKLNCLICTVDWGLQLHCLSFQDKWIGCRDHCKKKEKEIHETVTAAIPAGAETLHFLWNAFLSHIESTAFIWAQDGSKKDIRIGPNVIREKSKLLYDNLKQKVGEGSKAGEFSSSRIWFDNFRK